MQKNTKRHTTNTVFQKQNQRLLPATFKKAIIANVNITANTADVTFAGNPASIIKNVPLASSINVSQLMVGDKCRVDCFSESNTADMVVAYTYGRPLGGTLFNSAEGTSVTGGSTTITHHLGVAPDIFAVIPHVTQNNNGSQLTYATSADATYIYITTDPSFTTTVNWFVIKF